MNYQEIREKLLQPFDVRSIEFRPGDRGNMAFAYVDVREYEKRLHSAAPGNWHASIKGVYPTSDGTIISVELTIGDIAMPGVSDPDKPTRAYAQAFKRACSAHGLGSYLYEIPHLYITLNEYKQIVNSNLAIAVYAYDCLGLEVPAGVRDEVAKLPDNLKYNPRQTAPSNSGKTYDKPSAKQEAILLKAGLTHDEIMRLHHDGNVSEALGMIIKNHASAEDVREALTIGRGNNRGW
jgi:hypothetical protein